MNLRKIIPYPYIDHEGTTKTRAEYLLELYAQYNASLEDWQDGILETLQLVAQGNAPMKELDTIIEEIKFMQSARQAMETWGKGWDKEYAKQNAEHKRNLGVPR